MNATINIHLGDASDIIDISRGIGSEAGRGWMEIMLPGGSVSFFGTDAQLDELIDRITNYRIKGKS